MAWGGFWYVDNTIQLNMIRRWIGYALLLLIMSFGMTYMVLKSMYKEIPNYAVVPNNIHIEVDEAKTTNVNGYISGSITNKEEAIKGKYIKFTFFNEELRMLGEEIIEIGKIETNENKTYKIKYKYDEVYSFVAEISD